MPSPSTKPKALIVDTSVVARMVVARALEDQAECVQAGRAEDALKILLQNPDIALITTSLLLPGQTGQTLAQAIREIPNHRHTPVLVISGDTQEALLEHTLGTHITDYFDKSHGMNALRVFLGAHLRPEEPLSGHIFYLEDSRLAATVTGKNLEKYGLEVELNASVEEAILSLEAQMKRPEGFKMDLVLCDYHLKGEKTGLDLVRYVREMGPPLSQVPILITTGEESPERQHELLAAGVNDILIKPTSQSLLVAKTRYHLWRYLNEIKGS